MIEKIINGAERHGTYGNVQKHNSVLVLTKYPIRSEATGEVFPPDVLLRVDPYSAEKTCREGLAMRMTIRDLVNLSKTNKRNGLLAALKGIGAIYEEKG